MGAYMTHSLTFDAISEAHSGRPKVGLPAGPFMACLTRRGFTARAAIPPRAAAACEAALQASIARVSPCHAKLTVWLEDQIALRVSCRTWCPP